jgi:glucose-6-phosphate isomerase
MDDALPEPPTEVVSDLVGGSVASRLAAGGDGLWPDPAYPGWTGAARAARPIAGAVAALGDRLRLAGLHRIVLVAAAGAGVAAEALGLSTGPGTGLVVLDTADPEAVAEVLDGDLDVTALVVVLPPDATPRETASVVRVRAVVADALRAEGIDPDERTVLVDAPDGPLARGAGGATVIVGPPDVAGLWSSLSAYSLVPAGLAGIDVGLDTGGVLAGAGHAAVLLDGDQDTNPALLLGALLAGASSVGLTGRTELAGWAVELVARGLRGRGPLPVRLAGPHRDHQDRQDGDLPEPALVVELADPDTASAAGPTLDRIGDARWRTEGPIAGQLLLWQRAVAVAAHLAGVDPTGRPAPTAPPPVAGPTAFVDGAVAVHAVIGQADGWLPAGVDTVTDALRALVDPSDGAPARLALHAYLDRESDASAAVLRSELARRTGLPTTFGWAPRCLAGTGQYDWEGPDGVRVCQLTGAGGDPAERSGEHDEELGELQEAIAAADAAALVARGSRVLRLHLVDRVAGLVTLAKAVQQL